MNEIIKQLLDFSVENTKTTHILLDKVLSTAVRTFEGVEIVLNRNTGFFEFTYNENRVEIFRNLNNFTVGVRAFEGTNTVAQCVIGINNEFEEQYSRIHNKDFKIKLAEWFSEIGDIDVAELEEEKHDTTTASDGTPVEEVSQDE